LPFLAGFFAVFLAGFLEAMTQFRQAAEKLHEKNHTPFRSENHDVTADRHARWPHTEWRLVL
jgi:hypothetical protein